MPYNICGRIFVSMLSCLRSAAMEPMLPFEALLFAVFPGDVPSQDCTKAAVIENWSLESLKFKGKPTSGITGGTKKWMNAEKFILRVSLERDPGFPVSAFGFIKFRYKQHSLIRDSTFSRPLLRLLLRRSRGSRRWEREITIEILQRDEGTF
jgi:hypothetical protein